MTHSFRIFQKDTSKVEDCHYCVTMTALFICVCRYFVGLVILVIHSYLMEHPLEVMSTLLALC
jgi:hypothetical protein